ncbi:MAG: RIP metalloprotease RseP [Acidobacteriota bacterium]
MEFLSSVFYFVIVIGVLVFIHEFGHFIAAKASGMRAEVFAIGMGYRLFGWNRVNGFSFWKLDETIDLGNHTDYRVAAFPIGGYVKISGMVDESMDTEFVNKEPQPWEFRAKPVWQRMIVICAGVIMNVVLAGFIFWSIAYIQGDRLMQTTEIGYVVPNSAAAKAGLEQGDKVLAVNGKNVDHWEAILQSMYLDNLGKDLTFDIERAGRTSELVVPRESLPDIQDASFGIIPTQTEAVVSEVMKGKPAEKAGLQKGDVILALNGERVFNEQQVIRIIKANASKTVAMQVKRSADSTLPLSVTPSDEGLIGIGIGARYNGPWLHVKYGFLESFPKGMKETGRMVVLHVQFFYQLLTGKQSFSKSVGGPVKIAQMANRSAEVGLLNFLGFMGLLSVSLAVLNILPLPALDGGHFLLLAIEGIFRRPVPTKVQMVIQQIGVVLLMGLMAFVLFNDIFR